MSRISTKVHVASADPALFGMFTACGLRTNIRSFRTVRAGSELTNSTCARCRTAITGKSSVPTVKDGITHVEQAGWKLSGRYPGLYVFTNEKAPTAFKVLTFSLRELRHAARYGF